MLTVIAAASHPDFLGVGTRLTPLSEAADAAFIT
jgi:hypothetical protein